MIRDALARQEPLVNEGEHYPLPFRGDGALGLGKPLKMITHPRRADVPIFLGAEGPKNVALATEIADGWVPLYYSPYRPEVYATQMEAAKAGFEVAVNVFVSVADDVAAALWPVKATLGFYIGGMGAKSKNFHTELMARMGYEEQAFRIQELFFEGSATRRSRRSPMRSPTRSRSSARGSASPNDSTRGGTHP